MRTRILTVGLAVALGLVPVLGHAKDLELKSAWPAAPLKVDGTGDQWAGHLVPLPDLPILVGVQNDADYVYVCVKTSDPVIKAQLTRMGLTVWANGEDKDKKWYGVRFPLPVRQAWARRESGSPPPTPSEDARPPEPTVDSSTIELIGPTVDDRLDAPLSNAQPVQAALGDESGVMVLQYRLPLKATDDQPLAVGAQPGKTIALGLETERPKFRRGQGREKGEGGGGEGGEGGGGETPGGRSGWGGGFGGGRHFGGGGGMGRGDWGERGAGMKKPIDLWTRVVLAAAPVSTPAAK